MEYDNKNGATIKGKGQFEKVVFPDELRYIQERRKKISGPLQNENQGEATKEKEEENVKIQNELQGPPRPPHCNLVGLALSGGGIRSATESLGVLQALAHDDILKDVDYLSTVSGGGYIGSCVAALLTDNNEAGVRPATENRGGFPLGFEKEKNERSEIQHLRAYSNYLAPQPGFFKLDSWRMVGWYIGAVLLNLLSPLFAATFLFTLGAILFAPLWRYELKGSFPPWEKIPPDGGFPLLGWIVVGLGLAYLTYFFWLYRAQDKPTRDERSRRVGKAAALLAVLSFVFAVPSLYSTFLVKGMLWATPVPLETFKKSLELAGVEGLTGTENPSGLTTLTGNVDQTIQALKWSGAFIVDDDVVGQWMCHYLVGKEKIDGPCEFSLTAQKLLEGLEGTGVRFGDLDGGLGSWLSLLMTILVGIFPAAYLGYAKKSIPVFIVALGGLFGITLLFHRLETAYVEDYGWLVLVCVASGLLAWFFGFIDINKNSLLNFYRDRLADCYIIKRKSGSGNGETHDIEQYQDLKLKDILAENNGPYLLINATLNLSGSKDPWLRGRMSDIFLFSKLYCGTHRNGVGYVKTCDFKYMEEDLTLADAMAISAAAFNSQMGASTNPGLAVLLSLLNVRLGRWLRNPNKISQNNHQKKPQQKSGSKNQRQDRPRVWWNKYFVKELFSRVDENDEFVLLTDGGHFENTGVYALLQRRCATIIVLDNGADPDRQFEDFAGLMRKARIDFGIQIDIDLRMLHGQSQSKKSSSAIAEGKIYYPDGSKPGRLIFIKPTLLLTAKESEDILEYGRKHPTFPQQTTLDQFFDEAQFESYRELSYQTAKEAIPLIKRALSGSHDVNEDLV